MKITYLGHSSLSIQMKNTNSLIDPFISDNGPIQCNYILGVDYDTFGYLKMNHLSTNFFFKIR